MKPTIIPVSSPFPKVDDREPLEDVLAEYLLRYFNKTQTTACLLTSGTICHWIAPMYSYAEIDFTLFKNGYNTRQQYLKGNVIVLFDDRLLELNNYIPSTQAYQFFLSDIKH